MNVAPMVPLRMDENGNFAPASEQKPKVVICTPTHTMLCEPFKQSLAASAVLLKEAGWDDGFTVEIGNPYISAARAYMTRRALDVKPDAIVYLDHDLSWEPADLVTLINTPGDVVCGTYRYKKEAEEYMGVISTDGESHQPLGRRDGAIEALFGPAGFLKVTAAAIDKFMEKYPELCFGPRYAPSVDLFNHGAHGNRWWGEDASFCRRWREIGGQVWIVPNLNLTHWEGEKPYPGNYHKFLLRQPGGSEDPARKAAAV
jgi:hypothetical protein